MEEIKFTVKMLAALMNVSIEELAKECDINYNHLKQVSAGNVQMTARDLDQLSKYTGIPHENIKF